MDVKRNLLNSSIPDNQDTTIIDLLDTFDPHCEYSLLEVGSGTCRFVKKIKDKYPNIRISCVEINPKLAAIAEAEGFTTYNSNILETTINKQFDFVHCAHVIEHFPFPQVTEVLDKLVLWTKPNGHLIIATPLMWDHFLDNIDHFRPYPPSAIECYFTYEQQQKKSSDDVKICKVEYKTRPREIQPIGRENFLWVIRPLRKLFNRYLISRINRHYELLWNRYRWPATPPDRYVMIIQKISNSTKNDE